MISKLQMTDKNAKSLKYIASRSFSASSLVYPVALDKVDILAALIAANAMKTTLDMFTIVNGTYKKTIEPFERKQCPSPMFVLKKGSLNAWM